VQLDIDLRAHLAGEFLLKDLLSPGETRLQQAQMLDFKIHPVSAVVFQVEIP
jgi:hypothetical protein